MTPKSWTDRAAATLAKEQKPTKAKPILEADFMRAVTDLATAHKWQWVHWLPGQHRDSWRTTYRGSLGKGFPDLMMVRGKELLFVELKRDGANPSAEQNLVLAVLGNVGRSFVWRPADFDEIEEILK